MNTQPSIFVSLEKYKNISVSEKGFVELGDNIVCMMKTIHIYNTETQELLFEVNVPIVKSWQTTVRDCKSGYTMFYANPQNAFDSYLAPHFETNYELIFPDFENLHKLGLDNGRDHIDTEALFCNLEEQLRNLRSNIIF